MWLQTRQVNKIFFWNDSGKIRTWMLTLFGPLTNFKVAKFHTEEGKGNETEGQKLKPQN